MILRKMQADYKIYMEEKKSRIIQNSQDGMYLIRYQEFNNAIVIKIVYNWHRDKQMSPWERTDKLKTDLSKYRSLICERTIITGHWEKDDYSFQKRGKESSWSSFHICSSCCSYLNYIPIISLVSETFLHYLNSKQSPLFKHNGNKSVNPFQWPLYSGGLSKAL